MKNIGVRWLLAILLLGLFVAPTEGSAQTRSSVGVGYVKPYGDGWGDAYDHGFTLRGRASRAVTPLASLHLQGGWTRFMAAEPVGGIGLDDADTFHFALGGRVGLMLFLGASGAYFFGDGDDGFALIPEAGVALGPFEVVFDIRFDGDSRWWGLRGDLAF